MMQTGFAGMTPNLQTCTMRSLNFRNRTNKYRTSKRVESDFPLTL